MSVIDWVIVGFGLAIGKLLAFVAVLVIAAWFVTRGDS